MDYYETILNKKKDVEELLTLHNRKSSRYHTINELKKENLTFDEWTIFLINKERNILKAVSSNLPNFYEKQNAIDMEQSNNNVSNEALFKEAFNSNEIFYENNIDKIIVVSCLSNLKEKIGVIVISTSPLCLY